MSSTNRRWTICAGAPWLGHAIHQLAMRQLAQIADHAGRQTRLERLGLRTSQVIPDSRCDPEAMMWGRIQEHWMLREIAIVSDAAGQCAVDRPTRGLVHVALPACRPTVTNLHRATHQHGCALIWRLYDDLREYPDDPTGRRRGELRACFGHIFRRRTGVVALDRLVVRLRPNKPASLLVLVRSQIQRNDNGARPHPLRQSASMRQEPCDLCPRCYEGTLPCLGAIAIGGVTTADLRADAAVQSCSSEGPARQGTFCSDGNHRCASRRSRGGSGIYRCIYQGDSHERAIRT